MNKNLLSEYVVLLLREKHFWRSLDAEAPKKKEKSGIIQKIKKLFGGQESQVEEFVDEWIEDQELYYDIDFSNEMQTKIKSYAKLKFPRILQRTKGDFQKAKSLTIRSLGVKFNREIREIERLNRERERKEDEDID